MSRRITKRVKTRWSPQTPKGAQSLLDQMERAILRGRISDDPTSPPFTTVNIPTHVANYMLDAIRMIRGGVYANAALHLIAGKCGRKSNLERDTLIEIRILELKEIYKKTKGIKGAAATATREIGQQFALGYDGADSARKNGAKGVKFIRDIRKLYGEAGVNEYIEYLIRRTNQG